MSKPSREEVEAAAKEMHRQACSEYDYGPWEKLTDSSKQVQMACAERVLEAAAKVRRERERVVMVNNGDREFYIGDWIGTEELQPGHELIARPSGGKEQG